MCFWLTVFIIGVIYVYLNNKDYKINLTIWCCVVIALMVITFDLWGYNHYKTDEYIDDDFEIYSLGLKTYTQGDFILGCGSIESELYYTFYIKDSDGNYKLSKVKSSKSVIHMDSTESPKLVHKEYKIISTPCTLFGGDKKEEIHNTYNYIIIVPNNTIKQEYNIN